MSLQVTDKELQKLIDKIGYKGCKNCKYQIAPLRMCKWSEQGGDGQIHFLCRSGIRKKVRNKDE